MHWQIRILQGFQNKYIVCAHQSSTWFSTGRERYYLFGHTGRKMWTMRKFTVESLSLSYHRICFFVKNDSMIYANEYYSNSYCLVRAGPIGTQKLENSESFKTHIRHPQITNNFYINKCAWVNLKSQRKRKKQNFFNLLFKNHYQI